MSEVRCSCGALNRVPSRSLWRSLREIPRCGKCKAGLPEPKHVRAGRIILRLRRYPVQIAIGVVALFGLTIAALNFGPQERAAETGAVCTPQFKPAVGDYMITDFSPRVAPFQVNTRDGFDYLVKLQSTDNRFSSLTFYVQGGVPFETRIPLGSYVLKYVAGTKWCGPDQLFGNRSAQESPSTLAFEETMSGYGGQTITLYGVPNGNFSTHAIPIRQF